MEERKAAPVPGWDEGLGWIEGRAVGAVDAGVESVRLDTWDLMAAVARAVVERRELAAEAERLGVAYAEQVAECRRLRALLLEEDGHGVD